MADEMACGACGATTDDAVMADLHALQHDESTGAATRDVYAVMDAVVTLRAHGRHDAVTALHSAVVARLTGGGDDDVTPAYDALMAVGARAAADDLIYTWNAIL